MTFSARQSQGFSFVEVLVAILLIAITIVPAMEAIQAGIKGAEVHKSASTQHYKLQSQMEEMLAKSYGNLLSAAQTAGSNSVPASYSDAAGSTDRVIVYLALYDADADPFVIADPNTDGDNNIYTGSTSDLLWIRVELEKSAYAYETLRVRG